MPLTKEEIDALKARVARLRSQQQQTTAIAPLFAKENATRKASGAGLPEGAKSLDKLLAEVNALDDPGDQTLWWQANFREIKQAQRRQRYAEAIAADERMQTP